MRKILIYGIGNPYRCDDTVGLKIAEILKKTINLPDITIKSGSIDGMAMLEELRGYDKVFFVDSIKTEHGVPGDIYRIPLDPLKNTISPCASHGIDFITAVKLGEKFGYKLPADIVIYAVEIKDNSSFSEECTEEVQNSIPELVKKIKEELKL
ncbi:MAG TPA: hydrogenase maturation protease [candidate division WOR-3 bacterium]|uniref:Hydrogenase maturation protease n=1 Tax=candidate division WOR-3 bacterium TaxID=2052148 RepID=A0A9C9JZZ5_UNCW3|nr:hydrogenase maturation protease [candidate division WOR-3 bacterium]